MLLRVWLCDGRFMDQGKFVPDKIIFEVLVAAVERAKGQGKHILLDGFPRWGCLSRLNVVGFCAGVGCPDAFKGQRKVLPLAAQAVR